MRSNRCFSHDFPPLQTLAKPKLTSGEMAIATTETKVVQVMAHRVIPEVGIH